MLLRSRFVLLAIVLAAVLASTGCEDEITGDDGVPSIGEFVEASRGVRWAYANGITPSLPRLRLGEQLDVLPDPRRRLRGLVPAAVANAIDPGTATATYDSTAGAWRVSGSATSGDTLVFTYEGHVAYFDTLGRAMREVVDGETAIGELTESVDLTFRTGDFETGPSYDVRVVATTTVDVLLGGTNTAPRDTLIVRSRTRLFRNSLAPDDTLRVDFDAEFAGRIGPRRDNSSNCISPTQTFTARWNGLEATLSVASGNVRVSWFDPEDSIQNFRRILFEQTLEVTCP